MKPHTFAPIRYVLVLLLVLAASFVKAQTATVSTDRLDYPPGDTAWISGTGFTPGETVELQILHAGSDPYGTDSVYHQHWDVIADSYGKISSYWVVPVDGDALGASFVLSADGLLSGSHAETSFTDANTALSSPTPTTAVYGSIITVTSKLTQQGGNGGCGVCVGNGNAISGRTVSFSINGGTSLGSGVTNASGNASSTTVISVNVGSYTGSSGLRADFAGDATPYASSNASSNFTVTKATSLFSAVSGLGTYGGSVTLTATVNLNVAGLTINFSLNGTSIGTANTSASGVASIVVPFASIPITVRNAGTYASAVGVSIANTTNYSAATGTGDLTINKLAASVTPNPASKSCGAADPVLTGTLNGFLPADGVTATYSRIAGETVAGSPYTISATLSPAGVLGNYSITYNTASFTITDVVAPVIAPLPGPTTINCPATPSFATATATDCSSFTLTFEDITTPGSCTGAYSVTRTWTATDASNNTSTASQTITVVDVTAPVITKAAVDQTVECDGSGNTASLNAWLANHGGATASDACSSVTWSNDFTSLSDGCGSTGSTTVIFTVTDACGNTSTTSATFTIIDTQAPNFVESLPSNTTVECNAVPTAATLTANDNCGSATVIYGEVRTDGDCPNRYTLTRTWTATDQCGNKTTHTQVITVQDTEAPTFNESLPINTTVECNAVPIAATLTANDNCGSATVSYGEVRTDGDCPNRYTLTRTWTATDQCGNKTTHTQVITVQDTQAPTFNESLPTDATVECNAVPTAATLTANDNCGSATVSYGEVRTDGDCPNRYTLTRTWTATDQCGNKTTHTQVITVQDTEAPTFNESLPINTTVECNAVPIAATLTANDNCGSATVSYGEVRTDGDCPNRYTLTRTWTATDQCGNKTTHTQVITVQDTQAPTFNESLPTDATVECNAVPTAATLTANDNCGSATVSYGEVRTDGDCPNRYTLTRTWTATDQCGNKTTHTQVITVQDTQAPTFTRPADITIYTDANCAYNASPALTGDVTNESDNCSAGLNAIYTDVVSDGVCPGSKIITRTWHLVDNCNNAAADQVQTITVKDNIAPTFTRPADITIYTDANCNYNASVSATGDVTNESDNCSTGLNATYTDVVSNGACQGSKIITRTWHLVDNCNNAAVDQVQTITVKDNIAPTFTRPADITIYTDANCNYNASVSATGDVTNESDNCSTGLNATYTDVVSNGACQGSKIITRTWHLVDNCNNAATDQVQTITVKDNIAPTAVTQPVTVALNSAGTVSITAAQVNLNSTDNCTNGASLVLSLSKSSFDCSNIGSNTVILTVTDACGNSSTASAIITVQPFAGATTSVTVSAAQYSDNATFTATIKNGVFSNCNNTQAATQVSFYIGAQFMGTANLSVNGTDLVGSLTTPLLDLANSSELNPCAGSKQVKAVFSGLNNAFSLPNNGEAYCSYTVAKEDASANYTGTYVAAIPTSSSTTAPVTLSATIKDAADSYPGDIRKARVMFVVKDYNNSAIVYSSPWFTPSLINAGDNTVGTVLANWDAPYNSTDPTKNKFYISVLVDCNGTYGYYKGAADITILYVINPCDASVNGGGYIVESNSAGTYAAEAGTQTNYGFNVKYQKNKGYQGDFNCIIRQPSTGKQYQIKSTSIKTLVTGGTKSTGLKGSFTAVANVYDISNPSIAPVLLSQNNNLTVTLKDNGEPGTNDVIGITLLSSGGSLLFSSNWDGTATAEQLIGGGNLQVQNGCSTQLTTGSTVTAMKTTVVDDLDPAATRLFVAKIGPNPSEGEFRVQVQSSMADPVKLMIVDISGRMVKEMTVMPYQTLTFGNTLMKGTYFLHMIQGKDHKTYKLIKL